jgi:hypothetical protein
MKTKTLKRDCRVFEKKKLTKKLGNTLKDVNIKQNVEENTI